MSSAHTWAEGTLIEGGVRSEQPPLGSWVATLENAAFPCKFTVKHES